MPLDKFPLVVKEFKGMLLSDLDEVGSSFSKYNQSGVPFDYAFDSQNLEFLKKGGMRTRNGIDTYVELLGVVGKPLQAWKIGILQGVQQTDRWLILTWDGATGRLYDTGVTAPATNPILSLAGMKYAFVLNAFGRMYITPWSAWANPLDSDFVYVYNGLYNVRRTKGVAPVVGAFAVAVAAGGNCTVGLHYVSVLFETDTGYITICPSTHLATPLSATTTAANATINGTNVPVGVANSGVIKRHIIITKVVVNPNGQGLRGYEPFIALTINDNTTTTFSFTLPDSSLVDSAKDYIEDNTTIPACVSLAVFGNRLIYVAPEPTPTTLQDAILVSPPNRPEQVNTTSTSLGIYFIIETESTVRIGPDYSGKPMCAAELNKVLYVFKEDSTFAVISDDELDPNEWEEPKVIDGGKGAFPFGVCKIGNNPGAADNGNLLVAGNHGLSFFNGQFAQNQIAEGIWENYAAAELKWIKVVNDPVRKSIYARIGDPNVDTITKPGGNNNFIFYANYHYGLDVTKIRWGRFVFANYSGAQIIVADLDLRTPGTIGNVGPAGKFTSLSSLFTILHKTSTGGANYNAYIFSESVQALDFEATGITPLAPAWVYETGYTPNQSGEIYTFGPLKLRVSSQASSVINIYKSLLDSGVFELVETRDAALNSGKYYSYNLNAVCEKIHLKLTGQNRVFIQELILYATERGKDRPRI